MVLYRFKEWQDETGTPIGTNPEISIYVVEDVTIIAVYEQVLEATIQGTVIDAVTDGAIGGAQVIINGFSITTDPTGFYSQVVPVSPTPYTVTVSKAGYTTRSASVTASAEGTYIADFSLSQQPGICFIATAAYGTPLAPQISILRRFRDSCLPQKITLLYYRTSPPLARFISRHLHVKTVTAKLLDPLVKIIRKLLV